MLGIPFAAGTEAPLSSVMGKQRCRRIESTYPIVSPQQNRISPYRSSKGKDQPQGGSIAVRVRDRRGSQGRSVMERIRSATNRGQQDTFGNCWCGDWGIARCGNGRRGWADWCFDWRADRIAHCITKADAKMMQYLVYLKPYLNEPSVTLILTTRWTRLGLD